MAVTFERATLPNGLTIIAEIDPTAHSAAVGFFVKTGARDEDSRVMGVSHFLEHMMFKGTAKRTSEQLNRDFDRIGAKNNAYTSHEMTCFHAQVIPERLDAAIEILADMLRPALREEDFSTEKGVILEEIAMYQDNPFWVLYEQAMDEYYSPHPLGHRVLGTADTIAALTAQQMREYFENRYSADNTVVALAGRLDFDRVVTQIESLCGYWQRTNSRRDLGRVTPRARDFQQRDAKVNRGYVIAIAPAPSSSDPRRYAASLAAEVLGGSDNSRLHWALIETGLAEEAQAAYDPRDATGDFLAFASGDPDRLDEIQQVMFREIASLGETLAEDDLAKIRSKMVTSVTVGGERPSGRMQRLGRMWTYLAQYTTLEEELARISAVTVADIRAMLRDFGGGFHPRTVGVLLPKQ
ncbi:MAG: M16 family metallopeptidase [Phycisphaerales bacterium]